MNSVPTVCYRFGEKNNITDFVQPNNPDILQKAKSLGDVSNISYFIRDYFIYPLRKGLPSTNGRICRFSSSLWNYYFKVNVEYMWSFPQECLFQRYGICISTALLCTSLLKAIGENAYVALGEVKEVSTDLLIGYHAWTVLNDEIIETTVHSENAQTRININYAYDNQSDWSKKANMYYVEHCKFNDTEYIGTTDFGETGAIISMLSLPKNILNFYRPIPNRRACDIEREKELRKRFHKTWQKEELAKTRRIEVAFNG